MFDFGESVEESCISVSFTVPFDFGFLFPEDFFQTFLFLM